MTMKNDIFSPELCSKLGFTKISGSSYYKESEPTYGGFDCCDFLVIQNTFLSIRVSKKRDGNSKQILSMYHIKSEQDVIYVISRLGHLINLFPEIVQVSSTIKNQSLKDFIEMVTKDIDAERKNFRDAIDNIKKRYGISKTGLTVVKDATLHIGFEEMRESLKCNSQIKEEEKIVSVR